MPPPRRLRTALIAPAIFGFAHVWVTHLSLHSLLTCAAAFLARSLNPSSIPNYLNIIGLLHKEFNLPNPLVDNWSLQSLLMGIKLVKGEPPSHKLPITPDILMRIHSMLNVHSSFDASFWAICLVSFVGMLRKSHLLASSPGSVGTSQHLVHSDFQAFPWGYLVAIHWSKNIRFWERVVQLPLPIIPESPLCSATAIKRAMSFTCQAAPTSQAFLFLSSPGLQLKTFSYPMFLNKLRTILHSLGLQAKDYACHSFHRDGASFAFQAGIPVELIKILGDWHSDTVLLYLTVPLTIRLQSVNLLAKAIISNKTI